MKVVFISPWFSEGMGYSENMFPKAMARLGVDVHLVTSTAQIYYFSPNYDKVYKPFLGPKFVEGGSKKIDGYSLHRLPYFQPTKIYRGPGIKGLYEILQELNPDIIQTFEIMLDSTLVAAKFASVNHCLFFTECHTHASVFRKNKKINLKERLKTKLNEFNRNLKFINNTTNRCYPIADDAAEIAISYYKVPKIKTKVQSLGVDTFTFFPLESTEQEKIRNKIRGNFGFKATDIVCIYTGRFTKDKNPHCLARAINELNEKGLPFKGLFIGNGTEEDINYIQCQNGCKIGSFVPAKELAAYYWAADIGVWPREESTSQLDAAACGLPLILSDQIKVFERIIGNGFLYKEGDHFDLSLVLQKMIDPEVRKQMGKKGIEKINKNFSWEYIATERLGDYRSFGEKNE